MITHADTRIAVLGAGAWGSTLAGLLASKGLGVRLWDRDPAVLLRLAQERRPPGVPELKLPSEVEFRPDLVGAIEGAAAAVFVVPSQEVRSVSRALAEALAAVAGSGNPLLVLCSKGLECSTLRPLADVVGEELPGRRVGVLSGPCIAREVAQGVPTSVVAAARDEADATLIRDWFVTPTFRIYTQEDVLGVELGGALKNVVAIAAGVGDGLGFGANTKSALLTRGLAEMTRLAVALGAQAQTLYGLAGLGDLAVTCFSPFSRNRQFGELLGRGATPDEATRQIGMTIEGVPTAAAAVELAARHGVEVPISQVVTLLCRGELSPRDAVGRLMQRDLRPEFRA